MSSVSQAIDEDDDAPSNLVEVGVYRTSKEGFDHGLVVLAMRRSYWLVESVDGERLLVEADAQEGVREQLARFDRESVGWPPRPMVDSTVAATDVVTPLLWALLVVAIFRIQVETPGWTARGVLDPAAIFERGEWWRVGTALFLHADAGHLLSNLLGGLLVFIAVVQTFGRLAGWLMVAVAALAGNLAIAALNYPAPYRSLGASTAIFAGVGLLTGRALRVIARAEPRHRYRPMFVALASGLIVLALYGAGGVDVDVGAHLTGFISGVVVGVVGSRPTLKHPVNISAT